MKKTPTRQNQTHKECSPPILVEVYYQVHVHWGWGQCDTKVWGIL